MRLGGSVRCDFILGSFSHVCLPFGLIFGSEKWRQNGMEWDRYDATTCRKIEQGYREYKEQEKKWMQQQVNPQATRIRTLSF